MKNKTSLKTRRHLDLIQPALFKYRCLITLFLLAAVTVSGASAETYYADTTANFTTNLSSATNGDTIIITDDFIVSNVTIDKIITIQSDGTARTLTAAGGKRLFYINSTGNLTLGDGVNLTGGYADYAGGVYVNGGIFTMNGGTITDNTAGYGGGGVYVVDLSTFTMNGGNIANNTAEYNGGGVCVDTLGTFTMTAGNIANNTATTRGGGVYVRDGGMFTMNDGTITNNKAESNGGGVFVDNLGTFTMTAGTITNNTAANNGGGVFMYNSRFTMTAGTLANNSAKFGGGVSVWSRGTFTMNGGTISDNNATSTGGGVYLQYGNVDLKDGGMFTMNDGTITNNTAKTSGGGVLILGECTFNMTGGAITNNKAENNGAGVCASNGANTFTMNGSATVNTNNDVYLDRAAQNIITVVGLLSENAGARNIRLGHLGGNVVHYNDVSSLGTWANNFALNTTWANDNKLGLKQVTNNIFLETNYLVTFYKNATIEHLSQRKFIGEKLVEPTPPPTLTGHTFNGWNTTIASGTPWNFTTDTVGGNTKIYANWTADPTPTPTPSPTPSPTLTPSPTSSGGGGNTQNSDAGSTSSTGAYTSKDGGVELRFDSNTPIIVTVFKDYLGGAQAPPNTKYLAVYDLHSTASKGTKTTLMFKVDASKLKEKNITTKDVSILHYYDFAWHRMTIKSIELVDGVYQFTVVTTRFSPFMIAYNVALDQFPLEKEGAIETPTTTHTTGPTVVVPTSAPTETAASPLPIVGILAGLCIAIGFRIKNT